MHADVHFSTYAAPNPVLHVLAVDAAQIASSHVYGCQALKAKKEAERARRAAEVRSIDHPGADCAA
jgi:hypothetical protein